MRVDIRSWNQYANFEQRKFWGLAHVYSAIPISSYLAGHEMNMHKPKSNQALISGRHWLPWLIPHLEETIMSHVLIFLIPPREN
jgi:hypothetical protein